MYSYVFNHSASVRSGSDHIRPRILNPTLFDITMLPVPAPVLTVLR